jgi:hypothetical protein
MGDGLFLVIATTRSSAFAIASTAGRAASGSAVPDILPATAIITSTTSFGSSSTRPSQ